MHTLARVRTQPRDVWLQISCFAHLGARTVSYVLCNLCSGSWRALSPTEWNERTLLSIEASSTHHTPEAPWEAIQREEGWGPGLVCIYFLNIWEPPGTSEPVANNSKRRISHSNRMLNYLWAEVRETVFQKHLHPILKYFHTLYFNLFSVLY